MVKRGIIEDDTSPPPEEFKPENGYYKSDSEKRTKLSEVEEADDEDRKFKEKYREKRLAELKEAQKKNKFGRVYTTTEQDYKVEVTEASKESDVVLLLTCDGNRDVSRMESIFNEIAPTQLHVKFMKIRAKQASHNYPDENCPTIFVYRNCELVKAWVTAAPFGGPGMNRKSVEIELAKIGVLNPAAMLGVDEDDIDLKVDTNTKGQVSFSLSAKKRDNDDDDEEDEEEENSKWGPPRKKGITADTGTSSGWKEIRFDLK